MTDDERDARIDTLVDAVADTNRAVAALGARVETLTDAIADTNTNVATMAHELAGLGRLMRLHLVVDHGYEDPDDE